MDNLQKLLAHIKDFEDELLKAAPQLADGLVKVHKLMRENPELGHDISDEQIGVIVTALRVEKKVVIKTAPEPKTEAGKLKALLKNMPVGDF